MIHSDIESYDQMREVIIIQKWAKTLWEEGTLIGELARMNPKDLSDDEGLMLICAYEGLLAATRK